MKRLNSSLTKQKKKFKECVQDLIVIIVVVAVIGGMLVYAHYDITGIVNG
jgi:hypothetical protein|tara:strand:- start:7 stop:156 length:150 start_codon:yes stop_codon:yes gene_type:complete